MRLSDHTPECQTEAVRQAENAGEKPGTDAERLATVHLFDGTVACLCLCNG